MFHVQKVRISKMSFETRVEVLFSSDVDNYEVVRCFDGVILGKRPMKVALAEVDDLIYPTQEDKESVQDESEDSDPEGQTEALTKKQLDEELDRYMSKRMSRKIRL